MNGKIILHQQNTNFIDISTQLSGVYFMLLTNNNGQLVQRSKVMKE
jgi:hypothetical protein